MASIFFALCFDSHNHVQSRLVVKWTTKCCTEFSVVQCISLRTNLSIVSRGLKTDILATIQVALMRATCIVAKTSAFKPLETIDRLVRKLIH